jgi:ATP-dependent RNA helicase SUPV3L1/SUV3
LITALLGPTNTGKTHRALERMLEHATGAIGVPLRLLAREVYDKLTMRVGESRVALLTGEEKRVPAAPSYWVCTVEAMPSDLSVDFLAVDEIQLAAHDQRGHVFTDRLLHARGRSETWFMGSDTMKPLMTELVPDARIARLPRLSKLSFAGASSLAAMPPRSAVVAFSAEKVFEIAERIRARRGGAAVVMGVLSPRARNAQVAMFQAGEVDHLVATDAIGMGLNLDVTHVAFAALRKFDGREARDLDPAEMGQIAGRAGRHTRDGTFGTVSPLAIPRELVHAVERHRFDPVTRLRYRNSDLDFSSVEALIASLRVRSPHRALQLDDEGEDLAALIALSSNRDVLERAADDRSLRLLWDVCRIPDYRKLLFESHVALLATIFTQLVDGPLRQNWVNARIREVDDATGDIDTLTARLSGVRTWSYVANQSKWLENALEVMERTRDIEDRLSDALHQKLVQRFVERTQRRVVLGQSVDVVRAPRVDPSHPFARLLSLRAELAGEPPPVEDWVESLIDSEALTLEDNAIVFDQRRVAFLHRGPTLLAPEVRLSHALELAPGARARVMRRLTAFARDLVDEVIGPLRAARELSAGARGLAYQLEQSLGTVRTPTAQVTALDDGDRAALGAIGVRIGLRVTYLESSLRAIPRRLQLVRLYFDDAPPRVSGVSFAAARFDPQACLAIGYPVYGGRAIRADVLEDVIAEADQLSIDDLAARLHCPKREVMRVAEAIAADA